MVVIVAVVGVLLAASAAPAQTLFHAADLAIRDSTGTRVGTLTNTEGQLYEEVEVVLRTETGHSLFLRVFPSRLEATASRLLFLQRGCGGRPYITSSGSGREPASFLLGPRQTVYVQVGPPRAGTTRSYMAADGQCVDADDDWVSFAPARRLAIDVADYFTPPFVLRATRGELISTGAEPVEPTRGVVAYDTTGKRVADLDAYAWVTGSGITIPVTGVGGFPWRLGYFESTDCTGPPFVRSPGEIFVPLTSVIGPRRAVHLQSGAIARRTMHSARNPDNTCSVLRTQLGPQWFRPGIIGNFAPTAPIGLDLADYFTEPFTVRMGSGTRVLPAP